MGDDIETRLAEATARRQEHDSTAARVADLEQRLRRLTADIVELRAQHDLEERDVERLEGFSLTRILASLHGARDDALARERAEAEAARYRVAEAEARWSAVNHEYEAAAERLGRLADAPAGYEAALADKERHLAGSDDPRAPRLLALAEERGRLVDELREVDEAVRAAHRAREALNQLASTLGSASSWSTYDTFFGGGLVSSAIKHSRLDEAARRAAYADQCLAVLRSELADLAAPASAPDVPVDGLTRFVDIWFDNIFTDLAVRERIQRARRNVADSTRQVAALITELGRRADGVRVRRLAIDREREATLTR
jgi:hypothetical protein